MKEETANMKENQIVEGKTVLQMFADFMAIAVTRNETYEVTVSKTAFVIRLKK